MNVREEKERKRREKAEALRSIIHREERTAEATRRALTLVKDGGYTSVAVYLSVGNELSTAALVAALLTRGTTVSVPVTDADGGMIFSTINSDTEFRKGKFGIPEPTNIVPTIDIEIMFVPLVAFDEKGYRLGHGKGCYDRYFAEKVSSKTKKIGLAFREQKVPVLPIEATDVPLDDVLYV